MAPSLSATLYISIAKGHPWARFGIDLCIGSEADQPITQRQMMFAPFYLMDAFDGAQIKKRFYPASTHNGNEAGSRCHSRTG